MKHQWHPRRTRAMTADGRQRWDRAYQSLLTWSQPPEIFQPSSESQGAPTSQEGPYADSRVCACLDAESGPYPDD
jgi:hypothetical protein